MTARNRKQPDGSVNAGYTALCGCVALFLLKIVYANTANPEIPPMLAILAIPTVFLIPAAVYLLVKRKKGEAANPRKFVRLNLPDAKAVLLAVFAAVFLICAEILLSVLFEGGSVRARNFALYGAFVSKIEKGFFSNVCLVFAFALLPAFCEEILYRGLLCREYEKNGAVAAAITASLYFGILHSDIRLFLPRVAAGLLFAFVMYATDSVLAAVISHFLCNMFGIYTEPYIISFYVNTMSRPLFLMLTVFAALASGALFCLVARRLYAEKVKTSFTPAYPLNIGPKAAGLYVLNHLVSVPFVSSLVVYIINLIVFRR